MKRLFVVFLFCLLFFPVWAKPCNTCHKDYSVSHPVKLNCTQCHVILKKVEEGHPNVVKDPGDLKAKVVCGGCHKEIVGYVKSSVMATAVREIAYTRFEWGAQNTPDFIYATEAVAGYKKIPSFESSGMLVDDFLRKKCLRCHLFVETKNRAKGCGACHMNKKSHAFIKRPTTKKCLSCHKFNRVGQDFVGLFERDYNDVYYFFSQDHYHHLLPDIHYEKGFSCVDCHSAQEIMMGKTKIKCVDCHKYKRNNKAHKIKAHDKLRCSACHSLWSFQDYGPYVIREDNPDWIKWGHLLNQFDPQLKKLAKRGEDSMMDWIDGKKKKGVWFIGWYIRLWETPPLGVDENKKVCVLRPDYAFYVSYTDEAGRVVIDNKKMIPVVNCYTPHTIRKGARACYSCHGNFKALGLGLVHGFSLKKIENLLNINIVEIRNYFGILGRPLDNATIKKLFRRVDP